MRTSVQFRNASQALAGLTCTNLSVVGVAFHQDIICWQGTKAHCRGSSWDSTAVPTDFQLLGYLERPCQTVWSLRKQGTPSYQCSQVSEWHPPHNLAPSPTLDIGCSD